MAEQRWPMKSLIARAPTRIDFGGGWTDVPPYTTEQGGCVCNLAITRHASVQLGALAGRVAVESEGARLEGRSAEELPRGSRSDMAVAAVRRRHVRDLEP